MDYRVAIGIDNEKREVTFARACMASRGYVIVRVPFGNEVIQYAHKGIPRLVNVNTTKLSEDDRRFVLENVTPMEHKVAIGRAKAEHIDRSR